MPRTLKEMARDSACTCSRLRHQTHLITTPANGPCRQRNSSINRHLFDVVGSCSRTLPLRSLSDTQSSAWSQLMAFSQSMRRVHCTTGPEGQAMGDILAAIAGACKVIGNQVAMSSIHGTYGLRGNGAGGVNATGKQSNLSLSLSFSLSLSLSLSLCTCST